MEGGYGSAVLEAANRAGVDSSNLIRLGHPDRYVMHAERTEQLQEIGVDVDGIVRAVREKLIERAPVPGVRRGHQISVTEIA